jgi:hypothetical protein
MPRGEYEDDDFHQRPPRLSVALEDELEYKRDALRSLRDRDSFGSLRFSGRFGDMNELGLNEAEEDESLDDLAAAATSIMDDMLSDESMLRPDENETTRNLRALMEEDNSVLGRQSGDLGMRQSLGTDGEPTFAFRIPDRSRMSSVHPEDGPREDAVAVEDDLDAGAGAGNYDQYSEASEDDQIVDYQEVGSQLRGSQKPCTDPSWEMNIHPYLPP